MVIYIILGILLIDWLVLDSRDRSSTHYRFVDIWTLILCATDGGAAWGKMRPTIAHRPGKVPSPPQNCPAENFRILTTHRQSPPDTEVAGTFSTYLQTQHVGRCEDHPRGRSCGADEAPGDAQERYGALAANSRTGARLIEVPGKQWHEPKKAFRPTAGLKSYEKRTQERAALAQMKAREKELKDEREQERKVRVDPRAELNRWGCADRS